MAEVAEHDAVFDLKEHEIIDIVEFVNDNKDVVSSASRVMYFKALSLSLSLSVFIYLFIYLFICLGIPN